MNSLPPMFTAGIKDVSPEFRAFMGMPPASDGLQPYRTLREFASAPADEAWVYRCAWLIATTAAGVPLRVYVRKGSARSTLDDSPDPAGQALQDLLDNVNPVSMSGTDLKAFTMGGKAIWGEAYWKKVRGRLGGPTQELYWLPATDVKPIAGGGWIDHFEYRPGGGRDGEDIRPRNMIAFRTMNLANPMHGLSPLSAIRYDMNVSQQATQQTASTLANWGIPPGAWVIPQNAEFTTQDRSLVKRALRALRGPKAAGKTPVLPQGLEWKQLALNPKDAEWLAARKVSRMTVCSAMGVPLVLAGDDEKTTVYANLRDAERVFMRLRMIPDLDQVADGINNWLTPEFDPSRKRLVVGFDYSQIESLRPLLVEEIHAWTSMIDRQVVTPNQMRQHFKLGPDTSWGDDPIHMYQLLPLGEEKSGTMVQPAPSPLEVIPGGLSEQVGGLSSDQAIARLLSAKGLYRRPEVLSFLAGGPLDAEAILGEPVNAHTAEMLAIGLRRRYAPGQIARGVPAEGYSGLLG